MQMTGAFSRIHFVIRDGYCAPSEIAKEGVTVLLRPLGVKEQEQWSTLVFIENLCVYAVLSMGEK